MGKVYTGTPGNDYFVDSSGSSWTAFGLDGNDQFFFTSHHNDINGGNGNDWLGVGGHGNVLQGDAGNDWLGASGSGNLLRGGEGNDYLTSGGDHNLMSGGAGADNLVFVAGSTHTEVDWSYADGMGNDAAYNFSNDGIIHLEGFGLNDNTVTQYLHQVGNNVVIDFGGDFVGTLINKQVSEIVGHFDFA